MARKGSINGACVLNSPINGADYTDKDYPKAVALSPHNLVLHNTHLLYFA